MLIKVTRRLKTQFGAACLALVLFAAIAAPRTPALDQAAPDFQVTTLDGQKLTLADFKGQVLVINFWATWCEPCRKELPMLSAYSRAQERWGLKMLAVTTEDSLPLAKLKPLAATLAFPMVHYFKGDYGVLKGVPTNYVIDRDGVLRYAKAGALTLEDLNTILVPLLRANMPAQADATATT